VNPVTVSRHIDAPVERVWQLSTDIAGSADVLSGVTRVDLLSSPLFGVGTRWRETRTIMKREMTEEMWVTAVEPERSYTVEADSRGTHYRSVFTFTPSPDGGTDLTLTFEGEPKGRVQKVVGRVMGPMLTSSVRKALAGDLDDLARAAERR
jgi:uncharacterized protein YndB with AHSA1/START domain